MTQRALAALALACAVLLALQLRQHALEDYLLRSNLQREHSAAAAPISKVSAPTSAPGRTAGIAATNGSLGLPRVEIDRRLTLLERAVDWLEAQRVGGAGPKPSPRGFSASNEPVLLRQALAALDRVRGEQSIINYPAWYFGALHGARGYFEHGPWAQQADVNVTNDALCGRNRQHLWPHLLSLQPRPGRKAIVATISRCAICDFLGPWARVSAQLQHPLVLVGGGNENWGMFSENVANRTVQWGVFANKLRGGCGATVQDFRRFLDDPRIVLWVSNQHQARAAVHPKLLSLPLGIKGPGQLYAAMRRYAGTSKTKLLVINNSGWKHREAINQQVASKFPDLRGNSYKDPGSAPYYEQIARAKFVLCPSGMGWDTYRHWEVLFLGSIPVMESSLGFDRTFAQLPVLAVRSFDDVTPDLLERTWADVVERVNQWAYGRLTKEYWMRLVFDAAARGNPSRVLANHPPGPVSPVG